MLHPINISLSHLLNLELKNGARESCILDKAIVDQIQAIPNWESLVHIESLDSPLVFKVWTADEWTRSNTKLFQDRARAEVNRAKWDVANEEKTLVAKAKQAEEDELFERLLAKVGSKQARFIMDNKDDADLFDIKSLKTTLGL